MLREVATDGPSTRSLSRPDLAQVGNSRELQMSYGQDSSKGNPKGGPI